MFKDNPFHSEKSNIIQLEFDFNEEEDKPKIYLAGPMAGIANLNHPAFNESAEALREGGWHVFNPAEVDVDLSGSIENTEEAMKENRQQFLRTVLAADLEWICVNADAIAMLPGWEKSYGARAEHATAVALDLDIIYLSDVTND